MKMKITYAILLIAATLLSSCQEKSRDHIKQAASFENKTSPIAEPKWQNEAHKLVYEMTQKVGDYQKLRNKKDVTYTYTYTTPDGSTDQSAEKYIFDGEYSYADYIKHERTLPELEGPIEQGYDGQTFWLKHQGKYIEDEASMKRVTFNRKTNFYWFTMFQKLMDPGLKYEYIKEAKVDDKNYDIVKVSFESKDGKPTDVYQLWMNKDTRLVDQFLFTVADFGVIETPFLMKVEYEEIDGFSIPSKRRYTKGDWDGNNINENWIHVSWTDIRFDTNVSKSIFTKN